MLALILSIPLSWLALTLFVNASCWVVHKIEPYTLDKPTKEKPNA